MKRRLLVTPAAEADVAEIVDYFLERNADAAERIRAKLLDAMRHLARQLGIGHKRADLTDEEVRFWPVGHFLIVYRSPAQSLEVVRVLHASRDVKSILSQ